MRLPSIFWPRLSFQRPWHRRERRGSHFLMILIHGAQFTAFVPAARSNCGFSTWRQCMATVSGIGGFCEPNQFYNPRGRSKSRKKQPR